MLVFDCITNTSALSLKLSDFAFPHILLVKSSSFEIFRSLNFPPNRQTFVTFHRGNNLTNFKISNFKILNLHVHCVTAMSMSISIKSIIFSLSSWNLFVSWLQVLWMLYQIHPLPDLIPSVFIPVHFRSMSFFILLLFIFNCDINNLFSREFPIAIEDGLY